MSFNLDREDFCCVCQRRYIGLGSATPLCKHINHDKTIVEDRSDVGKI